MFDFNFSVKTEILFGKDQLKYLPEKILENGSRVLICYGGGSIKKIGLYDKVISLLDENNIFYKELSAIKPNPRIDKVREGLEIIRENKLDFILAVGGGSVIDTAKLLACAVFTDKDPWKIIKKEVEIEKALKIGVILTIAATGSEMDSIGVVSNPQTKEKLSFSSPLLVPCFAIENPEFTYSVSPYQTASGVADIMSHTMENYFSLDDGCYLQNKIAEGILKTCIKFGPIALKEPTNYNARANILWASAWAINGLLNKGKNTSWTVHSMEHELSAYYDITHGVGLAILTPRFLNYILNEKTEKMLSDFAINVFDVEDTNNYRENAKKGIEALYKFFKDDLNLPMSLEELNITDDYFEEMAEKQAKRSNGYVGGVVPLEAKDVVQIYKASMKDEY